MTSKQVEKKEGYACEDCHYYKAHRCKLWEVKVIEPDDSHCESYITDKMFYSISGNGKR